MHQYECELCKSAYSTNEDQKNHVCDTCRKIYDVEDDYIYGLGEYADEKKKTITNSIIREEHCAPQTQEHFLKTEDPRKNSVPTSKAALTKDSSQKQPENDYMVQLHNINSNLEKLIDLEIRNVNLNESIDNAMYENVIKTLCSIATNIKTLKNIAVIMFTLFIIECICMLFIFVF